MGRCAVLVIRRCDGRARDIQLLLLHNVTQGAKNYFNLFSPLQSLGCRGEKSQFSILKHCYLQHLIYFQDGYPLDFIGLQPENPSNKMPNQLSEKPVCYNNHVLRTLGR